jgi:hypothetical protein
MSRGTVCLLRGLLLLLACLVAALPVGLCLCGHEHERTAEHQQDDECHCHDSPRVATLPPTLDVGTDTPLSLPLRSVDLIPATPHVVRPAFRSESPPGYSSLPLYLSVGRLLI